MNEHPFQMVNAHLMIVNPMQHSSMVEIYLPVGFAGSKNAWIA
jgi:hypothetical protein